MSPELRVSLTKSLIAAAVATCAAGLGTMTTAGAAEPKCVGTEPAEVQPCDYPDAACEPCESRGPSLPPNTLLCIWIEYSGTSVRECVSAPTGHRALQWGVGNRLCDVLEHLVRVRSCRSGVRRRVILRDTRVREALLPGLHPRPAGRDTSPDRTLPGVESIRVYPHQTAHSHRERGPQPCLMRRLNR